MSCALNDVADIEDTIVSADAVGVSRLKQNGIVGVDAKRFRRLTKKKEESCGCDGENAVGDSFIPGKIFGNY